MGVEDLNNIDSLWEKYFATKNGEVKNEIITHYL